jgi:chromate transporter
MPVGAGSVSEVFVAFLRLGLTSFGGPVAHLSYFRREFVERRRWLGESEYARLLALCQFLPGPASSQAGFSLGLIRAGWPGAFAAFVAFTLPSASLLFAFGSLSSYLSGPVAEAAIHGLKLVAVAVVGQAVHGMARQLCPDAPRAAIAAVAAAIVLAGPHGALQVAIIAAGALAGWVFCRNLPLLEEAALPLPHGMRLGAALLALFAFLLVALPLAARDSPGLLCIADRFYRVGALVFGGGHVVLPLLQDTVVAPGLVSNEDFLAGYGAAQAVPGPLFTVSAYLGALMPGPQGALAGAAVALAAIFLPGFLLVAGALPFWHSLAGRPLAAAAMAGANAAVVGLLGAALYDPVWVSAIGGPVDVAVAVIAFTLLVAWRASPLVAVLWCVSATVAAALW